MPDAIWYKSSVYLSQHRFRVDSFQPNQGGQNMVNATDIPETIRSFHRRCEFPLLSHAATTTTTNNNNNNDNNNNNNNDNDNNNNNNSNSNEAKTGRLMFGIFVAFIRSGSCPHAQDILPIAIVKADLHSSAGGSTNHFVEEVVDGMRKRPIETEAFHTLCSWSTVGLVLQILYNTCWAARRVRTNRATNGWRWYHQDFWRPSIRFGRSALRYHQLGYNSTVSSIKLSQLDQPTPTLPSSAWAMSKSGAKMHFSAPSTGAKALRKRGH